MHLPPAATKRPQIDDDDDKSDLHKEKKREKKDTQQVTWESIQTVEFWLEDAISRDAGASYSTVQSSAEISTMVPLGTTVAAGNDPSGEPIRVSVPAIGAMNTGDASAPPISQTPDTSA